jgi:hypothetical protein
MTMTKNTLTRARRVIRDCEESEQLLQRAKMTVVKDELVDLLHQLSLLPLPDDRPNFYERLEDFLLAELFPS